MNRQRLFERIKSMEHRVEPSHSVTAVKTSIANYLTLLLNTQQGTSLIADDFGMPDFSRPDLINGMDSIHWLENAIKESLQKYEPRITSLNVGYQPNPSDPVALTFDITVLVVLDEQQDTFGLEMLVKPNGQVIVNV